MWRFDNIPDSGGCSDRIDIRDQVDPFVPDWPTYVREAYADGYRAGYTDGRHAASTEITYDFLRPRLGENGSSCSL
ncbi:hypothetical protein [Brevibacillus sp. SKDU10]|uniref:hypothetical protein n=1 Tax=Brevibacillus sp. SKDU10 TaxID=1247872 RepID=UPI0012FB4394|nr:hypothetical protein [Brevibacillus sp. SKDU10]